MVFSTAQRILSSDVEVTSPATSSEMKIVKNKWTTGRRKQGSCPCGLYWRHRQPIMPCLIFFAIVNCLIGGSGRTVNAFSPRYSLPSKRRIEQAKDDRFGQKVFSIDIWSPPRQRTQRKLWFAAETKSAHECSQVAETSANPEISADEKANLVKRNIAQAMLKNKGVRNRRSPAKKNKRRVTSVGPVRNKSASRARSRNGGGVGRVYGSLQSAASVAACTTKSKSPTEVKVNDKSPKNDRLDKTGGKGGLKLDKSVIHSTITKALDQHDELALVKREMAGEGVFGLLGERLHDEKVRLESLVPLPGTILLQSDSCDDRPPSSKTKDLACVRVATPMDDLPIACLRLSVFSDFSPEVRTQFRSRSCEVLAQRRLRGATCLVATIPGAGKEIVGTAECSFHEFEGTQLGKSRPVEKLMYVTEVAVDPDQRRGGIGTRLLEGVNRLARLRNVETLYLHVDVTNFGALSLYEKAGYRPVKKALPIYETFTSSLNLHDGATKGRCHHLLHKHMTPQTTWVRPEEEVPASLGFEVKSGSSVLVA